MTIRMRHLSIALAWLLALGTSPLPGQDRTLDWPEVTVTAHLDADGRLVVRERQVMRFTGDWNGGERRFDVPFGQRFALDSLVRIDSATGARLRLVAGDLGRVDGFDWTDGRTLRWRSRLPEDAPFDRTERTYEIFFTYEAILQPQDDGRYVLDHDFAFADRDGVFERFTLDLTIDPAWRPTVDFTGHYEATPLAPWTGFVVTVPLQRVAAGRPAAVRFGAEPGVRRGLLGVLVAGLVAIIALLMRREARLGRFAPLTPLAELTPDWLERELFAHLPEVVGAAWDESTSAPEVAATLARLVQEGKLSSRVETSRVLVFRKHVLHLTLVTNRDRLRPHERALIDALFEAHEKTTNTDRVRERYRSTGFDPAKTIRAGVASLVESMATEPSTAAGAPSRYPTAVLLVAAVALLVAGAVRDPADLAVAAPAIGASLPLLLIGRLGAIAWQRRVDRLPVAALGFVLPLVAMAVLLGRLLLVENRWRTDALVLAGLTCWVLALANSIANSARSRQTPARIALRKRLASARAFFGAELATPEPRLEDAWYPYLLAFGLGPHVDRWFASFGAASSSAASMRTASVGGSSGSGGGGGGFSGFGGGGGFSGGGGGASFGAAFGAAVGGMAASVPAPSSSSSGGGGGGGGSSGGGGGGGW